MSKFSAQSKAEMAAAAKNTPEGKFAAARSNLLVAVAFTLVNFVLALAQSDTYFLFSATFPQAALAYGAAFEMGGLSGMYVAGIVLALLCIGLYFLCWLLSKKNYGWLLAATVLFAIDTVLLFVVYEIQIGIALDVVFHIWVLVSLISGVVASRQIRNQVPEEELPDAAPAAMVMVNGEPIAEENTDTQ